MFNTTRLRPKNTFNQTYKLNPIRIQTLNSQLQALNY